MRSVGSCERGRVKHCGAWTPSTRKKKSDRISGLSNELLSNPPRILVGASRRTFSQPLRSSRSHGSLAGGRETVPIAGATSKCEPSSPDAPELPFCVDCVQFPACE
jgi:hypothetical protein